VEDTVRLFVSWLFHRIKKCEMEIVQRLTAIERWCVCLWWVVAPFV
jgi:hypothetical protein